MTPAGAQRVGWIESLNCVERLSVRWLRNWQRDPQGQADLQALLSQTLGRRRASNTHAVFAEMMDIGARHGRRSLCRHASQCRCLGADEAIFAHLVTAAVDGETEDAALLASLFIRSDMALCFAGLASEFGLSLAACARDMPRRASKHFGESPNGGVENAHAPMSLRLH